MRALPRKKNRIKPVRRPKPVRSYFDQLRKQIAERRRKHSLMSRARDILRSRRKRKRRT